MSNNDFEALAPEDSLYVCMACGKTSQNQMGSVGASYGWDESCFMHAALYPKARLKYGEGSNCIVAIIPDEEAPKAARHGL